MTVFDCGSCICRICLLWWSDRCPYGGCWDEHRARINPYDQAHPDDPPRKEWSNWATDQAYWCRGGVFYPTDKCEHFIKYDEAATQVQDCLWASCSRNPETRRREVRTICMQPEIGRRVTHRLNAAQ